MPPRIRSSQASPAISSLAITDLCSSCVRRAFSNTPDRPTRLRNVMFSWLNGPGENFRHPIHNSTNYLTAYDRSGKPLENRDRPQGGDSADTRALDSEAEGKQSAGEGTKNLTRPFPLNRQFFSQPVLSEALRTEIWRRVKVDGKSVRTVSVEMGVDMRRVGAVVRLVEVENRMRRENAPLALPYARAIHSMIPTTPYNPSHPTAITPHEPINDLPVHKLTEPQLFYPTSESRAFNRTDAGRVFSAAPRLPSSEDIAEGGSPIAPWQDTSLELIGKKGTEIPVLKPADSRIPHPHLIPFAQDKSPDSPYAGESRLIAQRYAQRLLDDEAARSAKRAALKDEEEGRTTRIETQRWEFVVKEVTATRDGTGLDGRGTGSPGYRYGVPSMERKRGTIKIPTRVEA